MEGGLSVSYSGIFGKRMEYIRNMECLTKEWETLNSVVPANVAVATGWLIIGKVFSFPQHMYLVMAISSLMELSIIIIHY